MATLHWTGAHRALHPNDDGMFSDGGSNFLELVNPVAGDDLVFDTATAGYATYLASQVDFGGNSPGPGIPFLALGSLTVNDGSSPLDAQGGYTDVTYSGTGGSSGVSNEAGIEYASGAVQFDGDIEFSSNRCGICNSFSAVTGTGILNDLYCTGLATIGGSYTVKDCCVEQLIWSSSGIFRTRSDGIVLGDTTVNANLYINDTANFSGVTLGGQVLINAGYYFRCNTQAKHHVPTDYTFAASVSSVILDVVTGQVLSFNPNLEVVTDGRVLFSPGAVLTVSSSIAATSGTITNPYQSTVSMRLSDVLAVRGGAAINAFSAVAASTGVGSSSIGPIGIFGIAGKL